MIRDMWIKTWSLKNLNLECGKMAISELYILEYINCIHAHNEGKAEEDR